MNARRTTGDPSAAYADEQIVDTAAAIIADMSAMTRKPCRINLA